MRKITFSTLTDIRIFAYGILGKNNLSHWSFGFDRAYRRMGQCNRQNHHISLSKPIVEALLEVGNHVQIVRTILHEVAHALVWENFPRRFHLHGHVWKHYCAKLGIPDETAACHSLGKASEILDKAHKWKLVNTNTGEAILSFYRKPRSWEGVQFAYKKGNSTPIPVKLVQC